MLPVHRLAALTVAACWIVVTGARPSTAGCNVRGVWELVSVTTDGKEQLVNGWKQMKLVTDRHWAWVNEGLRRDTLPLKTEIDTLRAYIIGGGAGTYTASGNRYVEQIDFFNDPSWIGKPWTATCRIEGDRWYHSFTDPNDSTKATGPVRHITELWRRIE